MSANPKLISTVRNLAAKIVNADGTANKSLGVAAPADGSRVKSLHITSDDTAAQTLQLIATIGRGRLHPRRDRGPGRRRHRRRDERGQRPRGHAHPGAADRRHREVAGRRERHDPEPEVEGRGHRRQDDLHLRRVRGLHLMLGGLDYHSIAHVWDGNSIHDSPFRDARGTDVPDAGRCGHGHGPHRRELHPIRCDGFHGR
jgi:hypothetical protein